MKDLLWTPRFLSTSNRLLVIGIPEVVLTYNESAYKRWCAARKNFNGRNYSVYKEYAELAKRDRLFLPLGRLADRDGFYEFHAALTIERENFVCLGGALFFEKGRKTGGKKKSISNTKNIRSMMPWYAPWRWPSDIQSSVKVEPANPDLVFYSKAEDKWRFCEVKGKSEKIRPGQLDGLAVLHLLTGSDVAIVRVVPDSHDSTKSQISPRETSFKEVTIKFNKGADLDWINPKVRKKLIRKLNGLIETLSS